MPAELIIAPPGAGKTAYCIEKIKAQGSLVSTWVVVPDRLQARYFRQRLAAAGGVLGVHVGRFHDLIQSICEEVGVELPTADRPLLYRLIHEIIDSAVSKNEIPYLAPLQPFPGFTLSLNDVFAELKRELISPEQFSAFAQDKSNTYKDLAVLYAKYQARLFELGWKDPGDDFRIVESILKQKSSEIPKIHMLVVDGFDNLDNAQSHFLKLMSDLTSDMIITFPGEPDSPRPAHRRFKSSIKMVISELSPNIVELKDPSYLPGYLQHIEKNLFEISSCQPISHEAPLLLEARSPAEEVREVLRWVKALVVRQKVPLTSCAVFTPNPEIYNPLIKANADEFGIPVRFTLDDPLQKSPQITSILNLLSLPDHNFNSRGLINSLRSPYFDFGLLPEDIDMLERISLESQIVEGKEQWNDVWDRLLGMGESDQKDLDEERKTSDLPESEAVRHLQRLLSSIFSLISPNEGAQPLSAWIEWLEDLLERLKFYENSYSDADDSACDAFREVLRSLLISETVFVQKNMSFSEFFSQLQTTLSSERFREKDVIDESPLLVGRITEARGSRYTAVAILGLSEGSFPQVEHEDPFLEENVREALGLESRLNREQMGLFYQAVTRSDQHMLITRPYLTENGEKWEESPYWKAIASLFENSAKIRVSSDSVKPLFDNASSQELLFNSVRQKKLPQKYNFLHDRWQQLQASRVVLNARRSKKIQGEYEGIVNQIEPEINRRFNPYAVWSASRLESYSNCPFQFFVSTALKLEVRELPKLGMDPSQLGSMLHKILEETFQNARDPRNLEDVLFSLQTASEKVFADAPNEFGFRPSLLWEIEKRERMEELKATVEALVSDAEWLPIAFEQKFGFDDAHPFFISLGAEKVRIHGVIDRVDKNAKGEIRVIDYKTGSAHMDPKALTRGYRLQLPIYAMAAEEELQLGSVVDGFYWKIRQAQAGSLKLAKYSVNDATGIEAGKNIVKEHLYKIIHGIHAAEFPPQGPDGGCPFYCPAVQWCWRYKSGW